jgi:Na+-driven multidrug efflux pump
VSWSIEWPMVMIMDFEFLISLTDVFIAGKLGKEYQAAVGFPMQIYFIFVVVANSLTTGVVSTVSRIFTSESRSQASESVFTAASSALAEGLFFGIAGIAATETVVTMGIVCLLNISFNFYFCIRTVYILNI